MFFDMETHTTDGGSVTYHRMIRHKEPVGLIVMLPGGNNAPDRPIMHLVRKGMLDLRYDVLNIDFHGLINKESSLEENSERVMNVVNDVLLKRVNDYRGMKIHLFGRSFGSFIASKLCQQYYIKFTNIVIVSPLSEAIDELKNTDCKVYLDPKDKFMNEESCRKLFELKNFEVKEYSGAGHNFEVNNDLKATLDILKDVVIDIVEYMSGEKL